MKKVTKKWIYFVAAVLIIFFVSISLLFLQINSNEHIIQSIKTFSNTAKAVIIGFEGNVGKVTESTQESIPVESHPSSVTSFKLSAQTQSWLVTNPDGVIIEETYDIGSKFVDNLPWGSIVTGNVIQTFSAGGPFTRLMITFPSVGWLTLSHHSRRGSTQYYVQPLNTTYTSKVIQVESADPLNTCADPSMHLPHTDFRGGDLQAAQLGAHFNPVHTNNNADCCVQCCRTPGCVYWTRTEAGECWLKGPTAVKTASPGLNLVSGLASVAGCVNTASNNNVNAAAEAGISVEQYASSARCVIRNATIRDTSICNKPLHPLYEAIFSEKCINSQIPKLSFEKCTPSKHRPFRQGNRCEITIPEPVHILQRGQALSDAPATTLLQPSLTTTDWTSQHPIGNGRFGALVGGNIRAEIIPVSVAGFYVRKAHVDEAPGERGQQPPDASLFAEAREDLKNNNIKEADKKMSKFIKKNLATFQYLFDMALVYSPVEMVWVEPDNVGASAGGSGKGTKNAPPRRPRNILLPTSRGALLRTMYDRIDYKTPGHGVGSEQNDATKSATGAAGGVNHNVNLVRPPFGDILVSDGILDMRHGVAYNSFIEHVGTSGSATRTNTMHTTRESNSTKNSGSTDGAMSGVRLHHREWFASSEDNVMVGTISCKNTVINRAHPYNNANTKANDNASEGYIDNALDSTACVHVALQLHRDSDLSLMPAVSILSTPIYVDHSEYAWRLHTKDETDDTDDFVDNQMFAEIKAYRFDVTLVSTPDVTVPATAISGVVLCSQLINPASAKHSIPANPPMTFTQHSYFDGSDPVLLCNHAHKMHIILSVESNGNIFDSPVPPAEGVNDYSAADVSAALLKKARKNVQKALKKGLNALRRDHMQRFNTTMSKVDIALSGKSTNTSKKNTDNSTQYTTSAVNDLQHRIESVNSGCLHSNTAESPHDTDSTVTNQNAGTIDAALLSSLFQYGRYLLYSSGSNSMINLQGLWADGPTSAWNGDYHLNINVQMSYWAADAVRVHEAMTPFNNFIQQLQTKGSVVARKMYGTTAPQGWVAHGFTDGYMDPSLYGDNQWALCVSCGAWAALQQWEHLLYTTNTGNMCGGKDTTRVGAEANIDDIVRVLETLRGVVLFFKEYMFRIDGTDMIGNSVVGSADNYTLHTGPTTSPENSYILLMTGDATESDVNAQVPAHLTARQQARAAHRKPYEVHSLTFSPSIDISVLRQVANAFTLTVQNAQHTVRKNNFKLLRDHCKKIKEDETFDKKLDGLTQKLVEDGKLAAEFVEMVAHMPGGGLPIIDTTLHDPEHQVALHLAKAAQKTQLAAQQQALLAQKNKENKASGKENSNGGQKDGTIPGAGAGAGLNHVPDLFEPNPVHLHPPVLPVPPVLADCARKLSARFTPPVVDLPLPLPDYQLYVREYLHPHSLTKTKATGSTSNTDHVQGQNNMASDPLTRETVFSEDLDPGHRHFSGLHWLYPNTFLPYLPDYSAQWSMDARKKKLTKNNDAMFDTPQKDSQYVALKRAAYNTLRTKTERGGGHTGWSATWEAALYARLHQPTMALDALTKLVTRYLAPNLLCLHPPLEALNDVQCSTCFNESPGLVYDRQSKKDLHKRDSIKRIKAEKEGEMVPVLTAQELSSLQDATLMPRGMVTAQPFSSKFQIDGNLGYLAALTEMLLQSHTPGVLSLLPALPASLPSGHVHELNARGNVIVSMAWRDNKLLASKLLFQSDHFWWHSPQQSPHAEFPDFHKINKTDHSGVAFSMIITAPNRMEIVDRSRKRVTQDSISACGADLIHIRNPGTEAEMNADSVVNDTELLQYVMRLFVGDAGFPCTITLCMHVDGAADNKDCVMELQSM